MDAQISDGGLGSFYSPQPYPSNGFDPNNSDDGDNRNIAVYPHSVASAVTAPSLENVKRKRGRPRKYGTPEQAAAAKRRSVAVSSTYSSTSKPQITTSAQDSGNAGQSFSPSIITVAAGEDVGQKIMMFMQQSKREICIFSASGSVSSASLRQPATSGGSITYEGRFDILSLSGSYVHTERGGRSGGLNVCLSSSDGQIIGGGVGGPLTAAGPVRVIVGTFLVDVKKDPKVDAAARGNMPSPLGGAPPNFGDQSGDGIQFLIQQQNVRFNSSMEWGGGNTGHGLQ